MKYLAIGLAVISLMCLVACTFFAIAYPWMAWIPYAGMGLGLSCIILGLWALAELVWSEPLPKHPPRDPVRILTPLDHVVLAWATAGPNQRRELIEQFRYYIHTHEGSL